MSDKKFHRSNTNRRVAGVIGGIAEYLGWDANVMRIIYVILSLFFPWIFIVAYIGAWMIIPVAAGRGSYDQTVVTDKADIIEGKFNDVIHDIDDKK